MNFWLKPERPQSWSRNPYSPSECIGACAKKIIGNPDEKHISTSFAERNNLNIRMQSRHMARLTNAGFFGQWPLIVGQIFWMMSVLPVARNETA